MIFSLGFDKETKKIQLFKKNISELGQSIKNNGIKSFLFGNSSKTKPVSELITPNRAKELASQLNIQQKKVNKKQSTWQKFNTNLPNDAKFLGNMNHDTTNKIHTTKSVMDANKAARDSQIAYNASLKAGGLAARATTGVMKGLSLAMNALTSIGFALFIGAAISGIDNYIHRSENLIKAGKEARDNIKSVNESYENNANSAKSLSEQYNALASGVDTVNGKNLTLNDDEYSQFLSVNQQLLELFPSLDRVYDSNGNSMVRLTGDASTLTDTLNTLLESQRKIANETISENLPRDFNGTFEEVKKYRNKVDTSKNRIQDLNNTMDMNLNHDYSLDYDKIMKTNSIVLHRVSDEEYLEKLSAYEEIFSKAKIIFTYTDEKRDLVDNTFEHDTVFQIDPDSLQENKDVLKKEMDSYNQSFKESAEKEIIGLEDTIQTNNNKIKQSWSSLNDSFYAWLKTDSTKLNLYSDQQLSSIRNMLSGIDWSTISDIDNWDDASKYIEENILSIFSDTDLSDSVQNFLSLDKSSMNIDEYLQAYSDMIENIRSKYGNEKAEKVEVAFTPVINEDQDTKQRIDNIKKNISDSFLKNGKTDGNVTNWISGLSDTELELAYSILPKDGSLSFEDFSQQFNQAKKAAAHELKFEILIAESYKFTKNNSAVQEIVSNQKTGSSLSLENFNSEELKDYQSALEYVNGSLQLNEEKVRKLTKAKSESTLATLKEADAQNKVNYRNNADKIRDLLNINRALTQEEASTLASLQASQSQIVSQCDQYAVLSANIREATGSYQEWLNAQNAPEQGDMGTDVLNAVQYIKDTSDPESENYGDIGTTKYETSTAFVIPDNIPEGEVQAYVDKLGTYFKDKSGADKFVGEALDKGLMEYDVDTGKAKVAAGKTMKDFASEFNWTDETMQAMFGVLHDLGGDFDWGDEAFGGNIDNALFETEKSLDIIQTRIAELNGKKIRTPVEEIELQTLNKQLKETQQLKNDLSAQKVYASISLDEEIANADQTLKGLEKDKENGVAVDDSQIADAQKNLQNLLNEKKLLSEPTKVEIQAALADTDNEISTYQKELSALQEGNYDLSVGVSTDEDAQARIGELNELIGNLNTKKATMQVILETAPTESALNELENTEVQPLNVLLEATDYASETLNNVKNLLNSITSKTVVIETVHRDSTSNKILPKNTESGGHGLNGTFNGSAFAQGDAANPRGQRALIGELGREIVVNPNTGKWRTYGDNGAEFAYIPRNAIVFNHQQSENLLERGFVNGRGTLKGNAFANGNAFASGTGIYYNKDNNTIPTAPPVSSSSSSASNNSTSQNTEAVEQNTQATDSNTESKEKEAKAYDWVAIKIKRFGEATKEIASSITDFVSSTFKAAQLMLQRKSIDAEIAVNEQGYQKYMEKANSVGLDASYIAKIQDGTIELEDIQDEGLQKQIDQYQEYYDKALECKSAIQELRNTQAELYAQWLNIPIEAAEKKIERYTTALEILGARRGALTSGLSVDRLEKMENQQKDVNERKEQLKKPAAEKKSAKKQLKNATEEADKNAASFTNKIKSDDSLSPSQKKSLNKKIKNGKQISKKELNGLSGSTLKSAQKYNRSISGKNRAQTNFDNKNKTYNDANKKLNNSKDKLTRIQTAKEPSYEYYTNNKSKFKSNVSAAKEEEADSVKTAAQTQKKFDTQSKVTKSAILKSSLPEKQKNSLIKKIDQGKPISTKGLTGKAKKQAEKYKNSRTNKIKADKSLKTAQKNTQKAKDKLEGSKPTYVLQNEFLDKEVDIQKKKRDASVTASKQADKNAAQTKKKVDSSASKLLQNKGLTKAQKEAAKAGKTIDTKGLTGNALKDAQAYNKAVQQNNQALAAQKTAANSAATAQAELATAMAETANQQMENVKAWFEAKGTYLSTQTEGAAKNIEKKKATGKALTQGDYDAELSGKKTERANLVNEQQSMQNELNSKVKAGTIKQGSKEWYEWQAQIDAVGNSITDADIAIQGLNDERNNINLTNLGFDKNKLDARKDNTQAKIDLDEKSGRAAKASDYKELQDISVASVANLELQNAELRAQQIGLDENSEKYQNIQSQIDSNTSAINTEKQTQEELNHTIESLPVEKLKKELDLLDAQNSALKSQIDLKKAKDIDLTKDDYKSQMDSNQKEIDKQKELLAKAKENANKYASDKENSFYQQYTQEVLAAESAINNLESENVDLQNTMRSDVYFRGFERATAAAEHLRNTISGIGSLITDEMMYDDDGKLTDFGITKLATEIKQLESYRGDIANAQNKIATIQSLKATDPGYSDLKYQEDLRAAEEELTEAIKNTSSARQAVMDIMKSQSKAELDAVFKVIDARNKLLQKTEEYYNYDKNMKKSGKELQQLKAQAAALDGVTDAESRAQKARLEAQIQEKQEEIDDAVHQQTIKIQMDGLDDLKTELQEDYDKYIKDLATNLDQITDLINGATDIVTSSFGKVGETITKILESLGVDTSNMDWNILGGTGGGGKPSNGTPASGSSTGQSSGSSSSSSSSGGTGSTPGNTGVSGGSDPSGSAQTSKPSDKLIINGNAEVTLNGNLVFTPLNPWEKLLKKDTEKMENLPLNDMNRLLKQLQESSDMQLKELTALPQMKSSLYDALTSSVQCNINIQGNADKTTLLQLEQMMPKISKRIITDIRKDLKKGGW